MIEYCNDFPVASASAWPVAIDRRGRQNLHDSSPDVQQAGHGS